MNYDDIIRMAREAGFEDHSNPELWDCMVVSHEAIERFAALVAAHERAACAAVVETYETASNLNNAPHISMVFKDCAAAIRAKGQA